MLFFFPGEKGREGECLDFSLWVGFEKGKKKKNHLPRDENHSTPKVSDSRPSFQGIERYSRLTTGKV